MAEISITKNNEWYMQGDVSVLNNVWNRQQLINGIDYFQQCTFDTNNMTQFTFNWDWGVDTDTVRAYPEIVIGYKPWDDRGESAINAKVSDIETFAVSADVEISGDTSGFNVSYDFWLTSEALGDKTTITTEVMVWTHKGDWANENARVMGTYQEDDFKAKIVTYDNFSFGGVNWRYVALIPDKDYLDVDIDMAAVLRKLTSLNLISADDYVTGYELGAEVSHGQGQMKINSFDYSFSTQDGESAENIVVGTKKADRLVSYDGNDIIRGRAGNDVLRSGDGEDSLAGGRGADRFVFKDSTALADHISDFRSGADAIVLSRTFTDVLDGSHKLTDAGAYQALVDGHFLAYDQTTGALTFDADGIGTESNPNVIVVLENNVDLRAADFDFI
jgi:serralysin